MRYANESSLAFGSKPLSIGDYENGLDNKRKEATGMDLITKDLKDHLIWLQILKSCSAVYQDEIRKALDMAIIIMQEKLNENHPESK